ncbi:MAG: sulfatase [Acidobacteria bacterium]|nr:sulfatase [Acidobacteriota bacterium]
MARKIVLLVLALWFVALRVGGEEAQAVQRSKPRLPNVVLFFIDDLGYADVGVFNQNKAAMGYSTPNIDRLAAEGIRLTDFYVPQAVCSASRAALLTGCYSNRVGISGALDHKANYGINANETTLAEVFKSPKAGGYATAIYGKWHLGHLPQFMPTRHGFDEYFGLPYSNDMWPNHPVNKNYYPPLPLIENDKVIQLMPDQSQLTTWYTEHAISFIERNKDNPFFLYVPHNMPHVPLFVSDKFKGKTKRGLFGDVVEEIDWSVGQVLATLKRLKLDQNTLVIFTSDNGPWLSYGNHAGSAKPLREGKGTEMDGGVREPFIARWPGKIPAGTVSHEPVMTIDLLPTLAKLIGAEVPKDRIIDGLDIWPILSGKKVKSPHDALYFYWGKELQAVRAGKWKLHLPHTYRFIETPGADGKPGKDTYPKIELSLFNLETDIGETKNLADKYPEVVKQLMVFVERAREDLGDSLTKRDGKNVRPAGK